MTMEVASGTGCSDRERCKVAHVWFNPETYELLELEAARRGEHPDRLAAYILGIVLQQQLVDEVFAVWAVRDST